MIRVNSVKIYRRKGTDILVRVAAVEKGKYHLEVVSGIDASEFCVSEPFFRRNFVPYGRGRK